MAVLTAPIQIERVKKSRISTIDFSNLGFGNHISDHMLVADYKNGEWQEAKIVPYGDMALSPAMLSIHYGQSVFEGMKAFKNKKGEITIFRPQRHQQRLNKSLERMCMPTISEEMFMSCLVALLEVDSDWIPTSEGSSLYLRPFVFASEAKDVQNTGTIAGIYCEKFCFHRTQSTQKIACCELACNCERRGI